MSSTRSKVINKSVKDPDLNNLFGQMVGTNDAQLDVIEPKYDKIRRHINNVIEVLRKFLRTSCPEVYKNLLGETCFVEIAQFMTKAHETLAQYSWELADSRKVKYEKYKALKESETARDIILTGNNIRSLLTFTASKSQYDHDLANKNDLSDSFICNNAGDICRIFSFSCLNFKLMFISDITTPTIREYMLRVLEFVFNNAIEMYREISSPDINMDEFSGVFMANIERMRKDIPRCDKAFNKLRESVGLLKTNFPKYYQDFVVAQCNNPTLILENYIQDVAKTSKSDPLMISQFRKIMSVCRTRMQNRGGKNPQISNLMNMVSGHMDLLNPINKGEISGDNTNPQAPTSDETKDDTEASPSDV